MVLGALKMPRFLARFSLIFLAANCLFGQAVIYSVYNSASWRTAGLPGAGIAQGSIFTILGKGLGPWTIIQQPVPLPTNVNGTSVSVTVGGQTFDAPIMLAWYPQINAIMPSGTPAGTGTITVITNSEPSTAYPVQIVPSAVGLYSAENGAGQASATDGHYHLNMITNTLHPGDYAILWGTGLGAIDASDANTPPVASVGAPVTVHVGNGDVSPYYAGRSASYPGLDQIIFQVPPGIEGCYVPVAVENGGVVSNVATIAVSSSGATCSDSILGPDLIGKLASGTTVSFAYLRLESSFPRFGSYSGTENSDFFYGTFSQFPRYTVSSASYGVSPGYCVAGAAAGVGLSDQSPAQLDAGTTLTLVGQGTVVIPMSSTAPGHGLYSAYSNGWRFLSSGLNYTVSGQGGAAVGAFSVSGTTGAASVNLAGIANGQTVSRDSDFTVQWTGEDPDLQNGQVTIMAYSANGLVTSSVQCTTPAAAHSFTIPRWVLATLPAGAAPEAVGANYMTGSIQIGQYNRPVTFQAQGLDRGIVTDIMFNGVYVNFQ